MNTFICVFCEEKRIEAHREYGTETCVDCFNTIYEMNLDSIDENHEDEMEFRSSHSVSMLNSVKY